MTDDCVEDRDDGEALYSELLKNGEAEQPTEEEIQASKVLESEVDPLVWSTELERVGPRLRVSVPSGGKEWRTHIELTKKVYQYQSLPLLEHTHSCICIVPSILLSCSCSQPLTRVAARALSLSLSLSLPLISEKSEANISKTFPVTKEQLVRIGEHIGQALERVAAKEKYINNQFVHLCEEYHTVKNKMQGANAGYQESSNAVTKLTNDLAEVSKKLDDVKTDMEGRGNSMTDTSPLVKIKGALSSLKAEIKNFDLRIGVVGHTLIQAKMRMKGPGGGGSGGGGDRGDEWNSAFGHDDDEDLDDEDDDVGFIND